MKILLCLGTVFTLYLTPYCHFAMPPTAPSPVIPAYTPATPSVPPAVQSGGVPSAPTAPGNAAGGWAYSPPAVPDEVMPESPPPIAATGRMIVTGASGGLGDGTYDMGGLSSGKMSYYNGSNAIYWIPAGGSMGWVFSPAGGGSVAMRSTSDVATPDLAAGWIRTAGSPPIEGFAVTAEGDSPPISPGNATGTGSISAPTAPAAVQAGGLPSGPAAPGNAAGSGTISAPTVPDAIQSGGQPSAPSAPGNAAGTGSISAPTAPAAIQSGGQPSGPAVPGNAAGSGSINAPTVPAAIQSGGLPSGPASPGNAAGSGSVSAPTAPSTIQATGLPSAPDAPDPVQV